MYKFIFTHALEKNLIFHAYGVALLVLKNLPQAYLKESNPQLKYHYQHLHSLSRRIIFG